MSEAQERLMVLWTGVKPGSVFEVHVYDAGEALVSGELYLSEHAQGVTLSTHEEVPGEWLTRQPFRVPIGAGVDLRLTLVFRYMLAAQTEVRVRARVVDRNDVVIRGVLEETYRGQLGPNTSRDEVSFFVVGAA